MLSQLSVARFAKKYPAVLEAIIRGVLELTCKYQRSITECGPDCFLIFGMACIPCQLKQLT